MENETLQDLHDILSSIVSIIALIVFFITIVNSFMIIYRIFLPRFCYLKSKNVLIENADFLIDQNLIEKINNYELNGLVTDAIQEIITDLNNRSIKNRLIKKLKIIEFKTRYDPSKFTILSIFYVHFKFLVAVLENGDKLAFYFDYTYGRPILYFIRHDESLYTFINKRLSVNTMTTENVFETNVELGQYGENLTFIDFMFLLEYVDQVERTKFKSFVDKEKLRKLISNFNM